MPTRAERFPRLPAQKGRWTHETPQQRSLGPGAATSFEGKSFGRKTLGSATHQELGKHCRAATGSANRETLHPQPSAVSAREIGHRAQRTDAHARIPYQKTQRIGGHSVYSQHRLAINPEVVAINPESPQNGRRPNISQCADALTNLLT